MRKLVSILSSILIYVSFTTVVLAVEGDSITLEPNEKQRYISQMSKEEVSSAKEIRTAEQFFAIQEDSDSNFKLMNDIAIVNTLGSNFTDSIYSFGGKITGQGYKILVGGKIPTSGLIEEMRPGSLLSDISIEIHDMQETWQQSTYLTNTMYGSYDKVTVKVTGSSRVMFKEMREQCVINNSYFYLSREATDNSLNSMAIFSKKATGTPSINDSYLFTDYGDTSDSYSMYLIDDGLVNISGSSLNFVRMRITLFNKDTARDSIELNDVDFYGASDTLVISDNSDITIGLVNILKNSQVKEVGGVIKDKIHLTYSDAHTDNYANVCYSMPYMVNYSLTTSPDYRVSGGREMGLWEYWNRIEPHGIWEPIEYSDKWSSIGSSLYLKKFEHEYIANKQLPNKVHICGTCKFNGIVSKEGAVCSVSSIVQSELDENHLSPDNTCLFNVKTTCSKCEDGCEVRYIERDESCVTSDYKGCSWVCACRRDTLGKSISKQNSGNNIILKDYTVTVENNYLETVIGKYDKSYKVRRVGWKDIVVSSEEVFKLFTGTGLNGYTLKLIGDFSVDLSIPVGKVATQSDYVIDGNGFELNISNGKLISKQNSKIVINNTDLILRTKQDLFDSFGGTLLNTKVMFVQGGTFSSNTNQASFKDSVISFENNISSGSVFGDLLDAKSIEGLKVVDNSGSYVNPVIAKTIQGLIRDLTFIANDTNRVVTESNRSKSCSLIAENLNMPSGGLIVRGSFNELAGSCIIDNVQDLSYLFCDAKFSNKISFFNSISLSPVTVYSFVEDYSLLQKDNIKEVSFLYSDAGGSGFFKDNISTETNSDISIGITQPINSTVRSVISDSSSFVVTLKDNFVIANASTSGTDSYNYFNVVVDISEPISATLRFRVPVHTTDKKVTSITTPKSVSIEVGVPYEIKYQILPADATEKISIVNNSSDFFVIEDGKLVGIRPGFGTVELKTPSYNKTLDVTVTESLVETLKSMISKFPATVTIADREQVMSAYNIYVMLTAEQVVRLTAAEVEKLTSAWDRISQLDAIQDEYEEFNLRLNSIPDNVEEITLEHGYLILACQNIYRVLSQDALGLITEEQTKKYVRSLSKYDSLISTANIEDAINQEMRAIPSVNNITLKDGIALARIRKLISENAGVEAKLNQALLTNFKNCEIRYSELYVFKEQADVFLKTLNNMPELEKITLANTENVDKLYKAYNILPQGSKDLLPIGTDIRVLSYSAKIKDLKAKELIAKAEELMKEITAVMKLTASPALLPQILDIENRYQSFTESQKAIVINYTSFLEFKGKILAMEIEKFKEQARTVVAMIDSLPTVRLIKLNDSTKILAAESSYNSLNPEVKSYVSNYSKLLDCLKRVRELMSIDDIVVDFSARVEALGDVKDMNSSIREELRGLVRELNNFSNDILKAIPKNITDKLNSFEVAFKKMMHHEQITEGAKMIGPFGNNVVVTTKWHTSSTGDKVQFDKDKKEIQKAISKELLFSYSTTVQKDSKDVSTLGSIFVQIDLKDYLSKRSGVAVYVRGWNDSLEKVDAKIVSVDGKAYIHFDTEYPERIYIVADKTVFQWIFGWFS